MADLPTRLDLFDVGRRYVLARAAKIDPTQVDVAGSDVNIFVGSQSFVAYAIVQQLAERTLALLLDGATGEDLDRLAFDRYQLARKAASAALGTVRFSRATATIGAGSVALGARLRALGGAEYVTTTAAPFSALQLEATASVRAVQAGKCLGPDVPVLRYNGQIVRASGIREGDLLMGPDSKPRRVLAAASGAGPLFKIVPCKGEPWICNDAHILTIVDSVSGEVQDIGLDTFLRRPASWRGEQKLFIPPGVDFPVCDDPPIDPYFLGVWFGDGLKTLERAPRITKPDAEIAALCQDIASEYGLRVSTTIDDSGCPTHAIVSRHSGDPNCLLRLMREVVGDAREFPRAYLHGSRLTRAAFLAGLLDTDGYLDKPGYYEITQKRRAYADGICFLARSLGFRAALREKVVNGRSYWRVHVMGATAELPMRIARKISAPRTKKADPRRTGFHVEAIGDGAYFGFTLDGDGRFLLGDFTVTHNSFQAGANTIRSFAATPFDPSLQVNNDAPTAGGEEAESDEEFRERVRDFWRTARRGILAAIEFGARAVAGVSSAAASEVVTASAQPARLINLYIADSSGVASEVLAQQVRNSLVEFRAAGIAVIVNTSIPQIVPIQLKLQFLAGVDTAVLSETVRAAMVEFVNSLPVNGTLYRAALFSMLQRYTGDGLIVSDQTVVVPTGDFVPAPGKTLRTLLSQVTLV